MTRDQWLALAQKRFLNVLRAQKVATERTLEQKISDAGPNNQRVEPFILTQARNQLIIDNKIIVQKRGRTPWFYLRETAREEVDAKLEILEPIYARTQDPIFTQRVGQALEIAVFRALSASGRPFLGGFSDFGEHDDGTLYKKVEPQRVISGRLTEKGPLDFVSFESGVGGIEVKNYRTWLYPDSQEVQDLLWKCGSVGAVPVLIARRVPFVTFRLLNLSGGLVHQNYNQLYAEADADLAVLVRDKNLLGYHDVRTGNVPDGRMLKFVVEQLPGLIAEKRELFARFQEIHAAYGCGDMKYSEWVGRILTMSGLRDEEDWRWNPAL